MNIQKYESRLPALRVDKDILEKLEGVAVVQNITLAEAHRQVLGRALSPKRSIPIVGTIGPGGIVLDRELPEAA